MSRRFVSRRQLLRAGIGGSLAALTASAGCIESRSPYAPPILDDPPEGVYIPPHFEGMVPIGTDTDGPIAATIQYSYPHRFWLLSGRDHSRVRIQPDDTLHLMVQLWAHDTDVILSGTSPRVTVESGDGIVAERVFWPMLSQRMGFHYGDNLALDGAGTYEIRLEVPPTSDLLAGRFEQLLDGPARFQFTLDWQESTLDDVSITTVGEGRKGASNALSPMDGGAAPLGEVPGTLPGQSLGTASTDEMQIQATLAPEMGEEAKLLLTAATPHNRFAIPMLGPVAHYNGSSRRFRAALDPSLGMHYRDRLPGLDSGQDIRVSFPTPPQVARHEGYETAFMNPDPVTFSLP